jgi:hypothetical protein
MRCAALHSGGGAHLIRAELDRLPALEHKELNVAQRAVGGQRRLGPEAQHSTAVHVLAGRVKRHLRARAMKLRRASKRTPLA